MKKLLRRLVTAAAKAVVERVPKEEPEPEEEPDLDVVWGDDFEEEDPQIQALLILEKALCRNVWLSKSMEQHSPGREFMVQSLCYEEDGMDQIVIVSLVDILMPAGVPLVLPLHDFFREFYASEDLTFKTYDA